MPNVSSVNFSNITNLINEINSQKTQLSAKVNASKADFEDDGVFNASAKGSTVGTTDLTMDKVSEMSFEDITELLSTPSAADINESLKEEETKLQQYYAQFEAVQQEVEKLKGELAVLEATLATLQTELQTEQNKLERYQAAKENADKEIEDAQEAYNAAISKKQSVLSAAEQKAYDDAIEEFSSQSAAQSTQSGDDNEGNNNNNSNSGNLLSFSAILAQKRSAAGITSSLDSEIEEAASNLANKKAVSKRYEKLISAQENVVAEKQQAISTVNGQITAKAAEVTTKETELNTISVNLQVSQQNVDKLQQQMAVRNFIDENETAIKQKQYEKDPEVIESKNNINNASATVAAQLAIAQAAEEAAKKASETGDINKANAEKAKAEEAKKKAEEAQQQAEAEKAKLVEKYGAQIAANEITSVTNINNDVAKIETAAKNSATYVNQASAVKNGGVVHPVTTDPVTGEAVQDTSRLNIAAMISPEELALVTNNNLDLTEVLSNGYPRYIIAQGKDGKYHIYERRLKSDGSPNPTLWAIARTYGTQKYYHKNNGTTYLGCDIVPWGSGCMSNTKEVDPGTSGANTVYFLTCVSSDFSSCEFGTATKKYKLGSPLSLDLNGDGVRTSENVIDYDIDGDGIKDRINDSADAVLVFDKDGDGISGEDGSECFGDNTDLDGDGIADGYKDGFEALKALALKEKLINNADDMELDENDIKYLEEKYGFKIKANGYNSEAQSLSAFGITCINLARTNETTMNENFDGLGNNLMTQEGATFVQNGETKDYGDIWHRYLTEGNPFLSLTVAA